MKKSVFFIIGIVYLMSVVVVTFFGMKINIDQFTKLLTKIEITNYSEIIGNTKYIFFDFDELRENTVKIEYTYAPENADYPDKVSFYISENPDNIKPSANQENPSMLPFMNMNEVVFTAPGTATIVVRAQDGSGCSDMVTVICFPPN